VSITLIENDWTAAILRFTAIINQELDDLQLDILDICSSSKGKETEQLQSIGNTLPSRTNIEGADFSMNTPPFTCNWTGCSNKTFTRKSDLK
jgi:hypothetical protein